MIQHKSKVYPFAWMTSEQFYASYGGLRDSEISRKRRSLPLASKCTATNIPTSKNWVAENKVAPVQDQFPCGDCYVFAALAVVESRLAIASNSAVVKLSEMQVTECM